MLLPIILLVTVSAAKGISPGDEGILVPILDGRIVGGEPTFIEEYPYQASLLLNSYHRCGAAIISELFSLTAAHCTNGYNTTYLGLRVGSTYRSTGGIVVGLNNIYQHPKYNRTITDYDISVLEVSSALPFGSTVQPIPLPESDYLFVPGKISQITGWGSLTEGGLPPSQLQVVEVPVLALEVCIGAYGAENVTDRMLCAGDFDNGGIDACQGDSGGPLVVEGVALGLVSWGWGCARPGNPGVYSNLITLRDYITEITGL